MILAVADTHAALWNFYDDARLSHASREFIDQAAADGNQIAISSITLVEIVYLVDKQRLQSETLDRVLTALRDPNSAWVEAPVDGAVAQAMRQIARDAVPDMPDRIIGATALHLGVPVISRDGKIRASGLTTVW
jgi:PIN domain nuclease of toxin-antitoxin system